MRFVFLGVCFLGVLAAACSGGNKGEDGDGRSGTVSISEGSGPVNEEPLWPVHPGWMIQRSFARDYDATETILDARIVEGREILPLAANGRDIEGIGVPSEPAFYKYLRVDSEGVWFMGNPREGILKHGVLLLPPTVQVGKKWESWEGGELRWTVEVTNREERDTIWGRRPVWTIIVTDYHLFTYDSGDLDANRLNGLPRTLELVEGRGPTHHAFYREPERDLPTVGHAVVPLDPPPVPPMTAPLVQLSPVAGGVPFTDNLLVVKPGAFPDPSGDGSTILTFRGLSYFFGEVFLQTGDGQGVGSGGRYSAIPNMKCARLRGDTLERLDQSDPLCAPADAVLATTSGETYALPHFSTGESVYENFCSNGNAMCLPSVHHFRGLVEAADKTPTALAWSALGYAGPPGSLSLGRYDPNYYFESKLTFPDGYETYPTFMPFLGYAPESGVSSRLKSFYWTRRHSNGDISVADVGGESFLNDTGRIAVSRLKSVPITADEHLAFPALEVMSVVQEPGQGRFFLFGHEGMLRELTLEPDGVRITPIAELGVPEDDFLVGAFVLGDEILAVSAHGFQGADPWYTKTGIARNIETTMGDPRLWRAALPASREAVRPNSIFGIEGRPMDMDMRVCWPPNSGDIDTSSWTLAGKRPAAVITEGSCLLLVREPVEALSELLVPGAWEAVGEVPGAGRVSVALSPDVWKFAHLAEGWEYARGFDMAYQQDGVSSIEGAPLKGGGWISRVAEYGPSLIWRQDHLIEDARVVADAAGNGLWEYYPQWSVHRVALRKRGGEEMLVDLEPFVAPKNIPGQRPYDVYPVAMPRGGVLLGDLHVALDGQVTDLRDPVFISSSGTSVVGVVLADGTWCGTKYDDDGMGYSGQFILCVEPDGTERSVIPSNEYANGGGHWIDMGSFAWVLSAVDESFRYGLMRVDYATLEQTFGDFPALPEVLWSGRSVVYVRHDSSGRVYLVLSGESGEHNVVAIDENGGTLLDLPELSLMQKSTQIDLVVEDDFFLLISLNHFTPDGENVDADPPDVIRVPRDGR